MRTDIQPVRVLAISVLITMGTILGGILSPGAAIAANTYYLSTTGSNSNPCSQSQPCATITKGLSLLAPGDTLYYRSGTYPGFDGNSVAVPSGTSFTTAITIAGYPGETVTLIGGVGLGGITSPQYVIFDNFIFDGQGTSTEVLWIGNSAGHIRIQNTEVKNAARFGILLSQSGGGSNELLNLDIHDNGTDPHADHGIYVSGSSNNLIDHCLVHKSTAYGIHVYNDNALYPNNSNTVRNNTVFNNGTAGVTSFGIGINFGDGNLVYNNVLYNNQAGLDISASATNTKVYNNTLYNNTQGGYAGIRMESGGSGAVIRNNIVYLPSSIDDSAGNSTLSNNLTSDPQFVNNSANNFRLQSGSLAIGQGINLSSIFTTDIIGTPWPQQGAWDIGSYKYQSSNPIPPAPTSVRIVP